MGRWDQAIRDAAEKAAQHVEAVIRRHGSSDSPWCVYSETGKKLGCYQTKEAAEKRLRQTEYWNKQERSNHREGHGGGGTG